MQYYTIIASLLASIVAAQSEDAISTISGLVSYENSAISEYQSIYATDSAYSSVFDAYSKAWSSATVQLASVTSAMGHNPAESSSVASYISEEGPYISMITAVSIPTTLPTDGASKSAVISQLSGAASSLAAQAGALTGNSANSGSSSNSNSNSGSNVAAGLMGAVGAAILGVAMVL